MRVRGWYESNGGGWGVRGWYGEGNVMNRGCRDRVGRVGRVGWGILPRNSAKISTSVSSSLYRQPLPLSNSLAHTN